MSGVILSEVPTVRDGWKSLRLDEACAFLPARSVASDGDTDVIAVTTACLTENGFNPRGLKRARMWQCDVEAARLHAGEILIARSNTPELVGRAALYAGTPADVVASDLTIRLLPHADSDAEFVAAYFSFLYSTGYWRERASGASGSMKKITRGQLGAQIFSFPPLAEQRRIAARLKEQMAEVERARAAAEAQGVALGTLLDTELIAAFHGRSPISNGRDNAHAPPGWRWQGLLDLARLETGHTPSRQHPEWWGGDVPWLALPDIRRLDCRETRETLERTNADGLANSSARLLPAGTVCLSRTASVGFVTVLGRPMATSQDFVNWVCGPELEPWFLLWALRAARKFIHSQSSGAIHKTVYLPIAKSFELCAPPLAEQQRLATRMRDHFTTLETARTAAAAQLAAIKALPAAYLRAAFTTK